VWRRPNLFACVCKLGSQSEAVGFPWEGKWGWRLKTAERVPVCCLLVSGDRDILSYPAGGMRTQGGNAGQLRPDASAHT